MDKVSIFSHTAYTNNGNPYQKTNIGKAISVGTGLVSSGILYIGAKNKLNEACKDMTIEIKRASLFALGFEVAIVFLGEFLTGVLIDSLINKSRKKLADNIDYSPNTDSASDSESESYN